MGLNDHRKTFKFRLRATPDQCASAFVEAFSGGGVVVRAKWDITRSGSGVVATYAGRKGVAGALSSLSRRATEEAEAAVGSQVRFEVRPSTGRPGVLECSMWLATRSRRFGFTADGRFFRPYMRGVEDALARLDPNVEVSKA